VENDAMVDDDAVEARPLVWARRGHFAA